MLTAIYFSIFTFYISQYSLKLKTLYNIETDYNYKIVLLLLKGKRMNHDKSPIILIGFMGTGKSTIGKYVADEQNLSFIDIDSYIEEKYKLTIPEIFSKHGEQYFRNLEFTCLQECINTADIIATGGGIIESEEAFNF